MSAFGLEVSSPLVVDGRMTADDAVQVSARRRAALRIASRWTGFLVPPIQTPTPAWLFSQAACR